MKRFSLLAAVVACSLIPVVSATESGQAGQSARATGAAATNGGAATALKQDMRKLWTDHVVWTRDYIIAAIADQPDAKAAADRPSEIRKTSGVP